MIGVRTWHTEADHEGEPAGGLLTDYQLGDANGDLTLNISDAVYVLNYLFMGSGSPPKLVIPRPVLPVSIEEGRFVLHADQQTVDDNFSGLTWVQGPMVFPGGDWVVWEEALRRSKDLYWPEIGGAYDWRLPNVFEQASLVDFSKDSGPEQQVSVFPPEFDIPTDFPIVLQTSTTSVGAPERAWKVAPSTYFDGAVRYAGAIRDSVESYVLKANPNYPCFFLPVRGPD